MAFGKRADALTVVLFVEDRTRAADPLEEVPGRVTEPP
jgi:hypothetical protein